VDALSARRKVIILLSCCLSLLIVSMDATIVNVAIPSIHMELHAKPSQLQWVIDIYTLVLASLLLLSGATADRFGRRRVFQIGLTIFAIGSLLCSLAPNIHTLIAARLLQGIGGSMLNPVARCSSAGWNAPGRSASGEPSWASRWRWARCWEAH
jgi:MFS family permease